MQVIYSPPMLTYPDINPVALDLGAVKIHWYGLMYLIAFSGAWWLGCRRTMQAGSVWKRDEVGDLIFYGALGAVLGGRLGYILFYDFAAYAADPLNIFKVWQGGMSFHGGLLGVLVAMWLYGRGRKTNRSFFQVTDFIAPLVPFGLGAGRIGNFINGELWGAPSTVPWAMMLPDGIARHPSQLYEALLEGAALFLILWFYSAKPRPLMAVSGLFLLGYGAFRFLVEFVRLPDAHIGYRIRLVYHGASALSADGYWRCDTAGIGAAAAA